MQVGQELLTARGSLIGEGVRLTDTGIQCSLSGLMVRGPISERDPRSPLAPFQLLGNFRICFWFPPAVVRIPVPSSPARSNYTFRSQSAAPSPELRGILIPTLQTRKPRPRETATVDDCVRHRTQFSCKVSVLSSAPGFLCCEAGRGWK